MNWYKDKNRSVIGYGNFSKRHCANRSYIVIGLQRSSERCCNERSYIARGLQRSSKRLCSERSYIADLHGTSSMQSQTLYPDEWTSTFIS